MAATVYRPNFNRPPWQTWALTLLEDTSFVGTTQGEWQPLLNYYPASVTVRGAFTGNVYIVLDNANDPPDAALPYTEFAPLGDPGGFDRPGQVYINGPFRWIMAAAVLTGGIVRRVELASAGSIGGTRIE